MSAHDGSILMSSKTAATAQSGDITIDRLPDLMVGAHTVVPTMHGPKTYVNFDNAASTPTFAPISDAVSSFLKWYSNVHRGTGFKSQLSSWAYEESRDLVAKFVGADLHQQVVIFTKNTTDAINKLANRLRPGRESIILTTLMEHHSNELPWRRVGRVEHVGLNADGTISREDFQAKIAKFGSRIKVVAITGASNVTGYINDLDYFAEHTHKLGARFVVDGAQLVPHRPIDMKPHDPLHRIDFLVFSAHKMYAPFGVGVLVGDKRIFEIGEPDTVGGGVVDIVTIEEAYWTDLPDKEEAGTPDIVGVVALGKAILMFQALGWKQIIEHERELTAHALEQLRKIPEVTVYGETDPAQAINRLGVISMNVGNLPHSLVAAILGYEGAIGVRSGCFCAHTYIRNLLNLTDDEAKRLELEILARDRSHVPGAIRMSFGLYNTTAEIDTFVAMIRKIVAGDFSQTYVQDTESGEFTPQGFRYSFEEYFHL